MFAEPTDIATRLGRSLSTAEEAAVEQLITSATGVIAEAAGKDDEWAEELDPVPAVIKTLTIEMVLRAASNPEGVDSTTETLGQYSRTDRFTVGAGDAEGIFLSDAEGRLVRRVIQGASAGTALQAVLLDELPEWEVPRLPFPLVEMEDDESWWPSVP